MRYKNEKYIYCCFVDPGFFIDFLLYDDQEEKVRGKKTDTGPLLATALTEIVFSVTFLIQDHW